MSGLDPALAQQLYEKGDISDALYRQLVPTGVSRETPTEDPQALYDEAEKRTKMIYGVNSTDDMIVREAERMKSKRENEAEKKSSKDTAALDKKVKLEMKKKELGLPFDASLIPQEQADVVPEGDLASEVYQEEPQAAQQPSYGGGGSGIYGDLERGFKKQVKAAQEGAEIGAREASTEAAFMNKTYDEAEARRLEEERREMDRQVHLNEQMSKLNEKVEKFAASPGTVGEMWATKSTGQKILGGIALFLGSAANGTTQNSALQTMQAALDSDLAKQKSGIAEHKGIYNEMLDQYRDTRAAEAAARVAYINNAQLKIQSIASQYKSEMLKSNAEALVGKLEEDKAKNTAAFMEIMAKMPVPPQNIGPATPVSQIADKETRERFVPGFGLATSSGAASKLMESGATSYQAISGIDELLNIAKKPFKSLNLNERARADVIKNVLIGQLRTPITGPGAMNEGERKLLDETIANPTKIFSLDGVNITKLKELRSALVRSRDSTARAYGIEVKNPVTTFKRFE